MVMSGAEWQCVTTSDDEKWGVMAIDERVMTGDYEWFRATRRDAE